MTSFIQADANKKKIPTVPRKIWKSGRAHPRWYSWATTLPEENSEEKMENMQYSEIEDGPGIMLISGK